MSFQQLLSWLEITELDDRKASEVLGLVEAALDELSEEDAPYEALLEIEEELLEGHIPVPLLRALRSTSVAESLDDVERLEREYRALAKAYSPAQWRTKFYLDLEKHLAEADEHLLLGGVDDLRERITAAWQQYLADYSSITTVSTETLVGHRLMEAGYEGWIKALDMVESEAEDEEILQAAESAVRLLVAVGQLDRDVKMQARSLGSR
jgi:hypothetical protein